jgi:hypothetical protein
MQVDQAGITIEWSKVVECFLKQASKIFIKGDKKAFFDAGTNDIDMKQYSKDEQKRIKKSKMVEGGKERWWELLLLDALGLYCDGDGGKDYDNGILNRLQKEHESLAGSSVEPSKHRRSFNQHLALQLSVWDAFCEAVRETSGSRNVFINPNQPAPPVRVSGIGELQYSSYEVLLHRLMEQHGSRLPSSSSSASAASAMSSSSALDDGRSLRSSHARGGGVGQAPVCDDGDIAGAEALYQHSSLKEAAPAPAPAPAPAASADGVVVGKTLPGVVNVDTTYVRRISSERWLAKLTSLTTSYSSKQMSLERVVQSYVNATVTLLRKHHPNQTAPFAPPSSGKRAGAYGGGGRSHRGTSLSSSSSSSLSSSLLSSAAASKRAASAKKRKSRTRKTYREIEGSEEEDEQEQEDEQQEQEDEQQEQQQEQQDHDEAGNTMDVDGEGGASSMHTHRTRARNGHVGAKRVRLLEDYYTGDGDYSPSPMVTIAVDTAPSEIGSPRYRQWYGSGTNVASGEKMGEEGGESPVTPPVVVSSLHSSSSAEYAHQMMMQQSDDERNGTDCILCYALPAVLPSFLPFLFVMVSLSLSLDLLLPACLNSLIPHGTSLTITPPPHPPQSLNQSIDAKLTLLITLQVLLRRCPSASFTRGTVTRSAQMPWISTTTT